MHTTAHSISSWHKTVQRFFCLISYMIGGTLGILVALFRRRLRERAKLNVAQSGCLGAAQEAGLGQYFVFKVLFYAGVTTFDTLCLWCLPWSWCRNWVMHVTGWESVLEAQQENPDRGTLFLTPHLGCFEISAAWVADQQPLTSMYRPPRQEWLDRFMRWGRERAQGNVVPAELKGVRALLKILKRGGSVGVLPDQVPATGDGVWATFFGRPAYTMTLASRLLDVTHARCIMVIAERRVGMGGIHLHFEILPDVVPGMSIEQSVQKMNHALEDAIKRFPEQYLWGYNRYKVPAGIAFPPAEGI